MIDSAVHAVPIVDDADHVLGIVTTTDVIRSLLHGPPRRGTLPPPRTAQAAPAGESHDDRRYYRRPTTEEYRTALQTARLLHVEARDPRHLGKTMLYLDQRLGFLEKVLELADRYLLTGQDEAVHALLLKSILAAKRAEEHATGQARVPFLFG
jgi:CBS domain-containing protein